MMRCVAVRGFHSLQKALISRKQPRGENSRLATPPHLTPPTRWSPPLIQTDARSPQPRISTLCLPSSSRQSRHAHARRRQTFLPQVNENKTVSSSEATLHGLCNGLLTGFEHEACAADRWSGSDESSVLIGGRGGDIDYCSDRVW